MHEIQHVIECYERLELEEIQGTLYIFHGQIK